MPLWLKACRRRPCRQQVRRCLWPFTPASQFSPDIRHHIQQQQQRFYNWLTGPSSAEKERFMEEERLRAELAAVPEKPPPRIHILGTGNIGCLIAHSLRGIAPAPPVTLLAHRRAVLTDFDSVGGLLSVERDRLTVTRRGYDIELSDLAIEGLLPFNQHETRNAAEKRRPGQIDHLIVTTKIHQTQKALEPLLRRLTPQSTIAFVQNGMGVIEEVNSGVFADPIRRPHYLAGVITHGVGTPREPYTPFSVVLHGVGELKLGFIPRMYNNSTGATYSASLETPPSYEDLPPTTTYLLKTLLGASDLYASHVSPTELVTTQLEKLAVNAVINPLTAIFDCPNGALLHNLSAAKTIKLLLWETSQIICALPELQHVSNRELRFSAENLYTTVVRVSRATAENTSSMLQDLKKGRKTEVEYINGYLVKRGLELGVPSTMNYLVECMVRAKEKMAKNDRIRDLPFERIDT